MRRSIARGFALALVLGLAVTAIAIPAGAGSDEPQGGGPVQGEDRGQPVPPEEPHDRSRHRT